MLSHRTVSSSQICTKEQFVGEKAICRPVHRPVSGSLATPVSSVDHSQGFSSAN